ncbi:MAG: RHS repeat-associated core domain-containing protein [Firmicutes bacterium]|nr:RHS repeat-associated core domain-containing protein [Bacillota bacterium]
MLPIDPNTFLDNYILEINPAGYSLFTGKVLEESTGLVYFGARWYDPEVGRFISVDPAEDGENWYALCDNDPVNYFDPDGRLSLRGWGVLGQGLCASLKEYGPKKVIDVAKTIATGSAIATALSAAMPAIAPMIPAAIPIIAGVMPYISTALLIHSGINTIGSLIDDFLYLKKYFTSVFFGQSPSDAKVRHYGKRISKVALSITAVIATQKGMNVIMKTGILQKIGFKAVNWGGKKLS